MFGIAWGIISITLMVAAGEGLRVGQAKVAEQFGKDIMIVFAGRTSLQAGGTRAGRQVWWKADDYRSVQEQSPSCRYVLPELGRGGTAVRSAHNSGALLVTGSLPPFGEVRSIPVAEGRYLSWDDEGPGPPRGLPGQRFEEAALRRASRAGRDDPGGRFSLHRDRDHAAQGTGLELRRAGHLEGVHPVQHKTRQALARIHGFDPLDKEAAGIWDTVEEAKAFRTMTDGMKYFLGAVGLATLFIGGIGVMNVMLVAVRERTREIGVRKAVGATRRNIVRQFFVETGIVVGLSGGVGMGVAYGICTLVNLLPMPAFFAGLLPTLSSALLSFALLGAVALLSALYPASRAASVDPIEALRQEVGG